MSERLLPVAAAALVLAACSPAGQPVQLPSSPQPSAAPVHASTTTTEPPGLSTDTASPGVSAASIPDLALYAWRMAVRGLDSPVDIQFPPDGTQRMFVVEQPGRIRILSNGEAAAEVFLDITDRVESRGNEQGLLGLAFHPQFATNGRLFVNYTDRSHHDVIASFGTSLSGLGDPASESILISVDDPYPNHNGGVLAFGPDGYLYAGLGDGGSGGDPLGNGQNTNSLLGKILRVNVDAGHPYAIPADNPFASGGGRPEVWAYGLRNPWRLSFDSATGDLFVGDVGQGTWEEIDVLPYGAAGGLNFGWNYREGAHSFSGSPPAGSPLMDPVAEYSHAEGGCSLTGGYVYRGAMREWDGIYLYGDYCSGKIWGLLAADAVRAASLLPSKLLFETQANITTFGQDRGGELYFADRSGSVYQLGPLP